MADSHHTIEIDGRAVPLRVRRNARARRLILRLDEDTGGAVVTIPKRTAVRDGVEMALRQSAWIAAQLKRCPAKVAFAAGARIPYLGVEHIVRHDPYAVGIVRNPGRNPGRDPGRETGAQGGEITVSGRAEHVSRRLGDWLKVQAKAEIEPRAREKAAFLRDSGAAAAWGVSARVTRVTVRDTRSRWGSCTFDGKLNFSWRLVLAPDYVLDYVVAHEVAHLIHRDHGTEFWALVGQLTARMDAAKAWLGVHGRALHRYG